MRRRILLFAGPVLGLLVAVVVAWLVLGRAPGDEVLGNVELAGVDVGGMDRTELDGVLDRLTDGLMEDDVEVRTDEGTLLVDPGLIDLAVDHDATAAAVLDAGRGGLGLLRWTGWLRRLVDPISVPVVITLDREALAAVIEARDPTDRELPVEPSLGVDGLGRLEVQSGEPGSGLDADDVADAIVEAGRDGTGPVVVEVEPVSIPPRFDDTDAEALLDDAEDLTAGGLQVTAGGGTASVPAAELRRWLKLDTSDAQLALTIEGQAAADGLAAMLPDVGTPAGNVSIRIAGGQPVIVPGKDGTRCCTPDAGPLLLDALRRGATTPVDVPLTVREPERDTDDLAALGIKEKIGEFTTRHPAGQSRVVNIHRIADIVRGQVIEPGKSFSVNGFVGRRTPENGFVSGGVIQNGVFGESIGGGISQFATTLFNAAFFGGLDYDSYQSHSIFIDRYPYGREATLSYPEPDLVISNTTPHGVLIWTEYTGSSITVSLWSTKYATGTQTGQTSTPNGQCTRVRTERTRTYLDGHTAVDSVVATYRPAEGVAC